MKTENQSNPNQIFLDWIGLDLILKTNQFDEQITKPKRLILIINYIYFFFKKFKNIINLK